MKRFERVKKYLLSPASAALAIVSALVLIFAFPDFEFWPLAWGALVPLFLAVEREKDSLVKSFLVGWTFGLVFFAGSCWWLTFAPITYAGLPVVVTYFFLLCAAAVVGIFPGLFGALLSVALRRFGTGGLWLAPFLWTTSEFLRMWLTGNNWNALGYSQAFAASLLHFSSYGGVLLVGFICAAFNVCFAYPWLKGSKKLAWTAALPFLVLGFAQGLPEAPAKEAKNVTAEVVAVQPNVPMSGITYEKYQKLLARHIELAEDGLRQSAADAPKKIVIFPESPMIFQYGRDAELQEFLGEFAARRNVSLLFNSAEMTPDDKKVLNSAVMIDERGRKIAQYDKIYLVPFGEYVPFPEPLASRLPAFVGSFVFGEEYDLLPFGAAQAGVMICFESHFGALSREYARRGADVLVEMTNDGYLGPTPVLRQHLANSVFRAAETRRPLLRVTNVGVTAYIDERGGVSEAAAAYAEATRVWTVAKSDGRQTVYVRFGEWFAWLCAIATVMMLLRAGRRKKEA